MIERMMGCTCGTRQVDLECKYHYPTSPSEDRADIRCVAEMASHLWGKATLDETDESVAAALAIFRAAREAMKEKP